MIELLLVTALVLLVAGALVFSFSNLLRGAELEEGTGRVEALIRFARAHAASTGRKVQLVFQPESSAATNSTAPEIRLTWELDPLGQPGRFENLPEAMPQTDGIRDLVQIKRVQILETREPQIESTAESGQTGEAWEWEMAEPLAFGPITFYPDGSCDSAEILLAALDTESPRQISVRISGITGAISRQWLASDPSESLVSSQDEGSLTPPVPQSSSATP